MFIWNSNLLQVYPSMGPFLLKDNFKKTTNNSGVTEVGTQESHC